MDWYELLRAITTTLLILCGLKSIIGWHFPWERCECCGKKWKNHERE